MNASDLEGIVAGYVREHLSPTAAERKEVVSRYDELQGFLPGRTFQIGSYARFTSTTPVNDLDVIYILPESVLKAAQPRGVNPEQLEIHRIVETLAVELRRCYGSAARVESQPHSVGVYFGRDDEFSIDVVPAAPAGGELLWVPESAHLSTARRRVLYKSATPPTSGWIKSDPKGYINDATSVDLETSGRFRKSAKALRKWRRSCKTADEHFRFKSFHLEMAVTRHFQRNKNSTCVSAIQQILNEIPTLLAGPQFPDRADSSRNIDEYVSTLTVEERNAVLSGYQQGRERWEAVVNASTADEARKAFAVFLGVREAARGPVNASLPRTGANLLGLSPTHGRDKGEEFLSDHRIPVALLYNVKINAEVTQTGFRPFKLLGSNFILKKRKGVRFYIQSCDVPHPYSVKWKVKNTGEEAARVGQLRGQIYDDLGRQERNESTLYHGKHYVECYIIKDGTCVAGDHIDVPIGREE